MAFSFKQRTKALPDGLIIIDYVDYFRRLHAISNQVFAGKVNLKEAPPKGLFSYHSLPP